MAVLEVVDLRKAYGPVVANAGVTLAVDEGEVCGVLGPNGAGKTTLVRQIVGLTRPDAGTAWVDGFDAVACGAEVRRRCALQPQGAVAINGLSARQAIVLAAALRNLPRGDAARMCDELLEELDLTEHAGRRLTAASGGIARLVAFCMAVVARPRLLILDEPTNDVDPLRRRRLWEVIRRLADEQGTAVLLVTHNVLEAERSVEKVAIIDRGIVVAAGSPASLRSSSARLKLEYTARTSLLPPDVSTAVKVTGNRYVADVDPGEAAEAIEWARLQTDAGLIEDFSLGPQTLEDTYAELVGRTEADDVAA